MGQPAVRMGDLTAHGGTIILGQPTVLIGKMPASALGDAHICPMCSPSPHGGGPILLGSTGVFIGKKPAARMGDLALCAGPPSMGILGCMTVLIGEVGAGSPGGGAGAAMAAASANKVGPGAVEPFPLLEGEPVTEIHSVECMIVDSAGLPLAGIKYKLKDPLQEEILGMSSPEGRIFHDGYAKAGSFTVTLQGFTSLAWSAKSVKMGGEVFARVVGDGFEDGIKVAFLIYRMAGKNRTLLHILEAPLQGGKAEVAWAPGDEVMTTGEETVSPDETYFEFEAVAETCLGLSDRLTILSPLEIELMDKAGKPIPDMDFEIALAGGEIRQARTDGGGKATVEDLPPGEYSIHFKLEAKAG